MHFYSGTTVAPEKVTNIKAYNRANAIMWFCYCVPIAGAMAVAPYSMDMAGIIAGVGILGGFPLLIFFMR